MSRLERVAVGGPHEAAAAAARRSSMKIKHGLVCALVVSLAFDLVPARVWAAGHQGPADATAVSSSPAAATVDFRAAVRDAVARLDPPAAIAVPAPIASASSSASLAATRAAVRRQGGGGKTGLIIGLVTTVVSVGATLYMIKQLKKDDNPPSQ